MDDFDEHDDYQTLRDDALRTGESWLECRNEEHACRLYDLLFDDGFEVELYREYRNRERVWIVQARYIPEMYEGVLPCLPGETDELPD